MVTTAIHRRVAALNAGEDPTVIARLKSGWAVMGDPQVLAGYCLLLPDPVVPDLNALATLSQVAFLADMARLGDAVKSLTGAVRCNYAIFGNVEPALHAHVFPRFTDEPDWAKTANPWAYDWKQAIPYSQANCRALQAQLAQALALHHP